VTLPDAPSDELYRAVIGRRNQDFYLSYFRRADSRGYAPISWHWPVLFVGLFWLVYRKQYRFALIAFALPYLAAIVTAGVERALPGSGEPLFVTFVVGFGLIWLPLNANGIYYRWVRNEIHSAQTLMPGQTAAQLAQLQLRGGTNQQLPLIMLGVFLIVTMVAGTLAPTTSP
jgi:Protein of unknown function (DUF2628)